MPRFEKHLAAVIHRCGVIDIRRWRAYKKGIVKVGDGTHARNDGAGPGDQTQHALRPHEQPGVGDLVTIYIGVQGAKKADIPAVIHAISANKEGYRKQVPAARHGIAW